MVKCKQSTPLPFEGLTTFSDTFWEVRCQVSARSVTLLVIRSRRLKDDLKLSNCGQLRSAMHDMRLWRALVTVTSVTLYVLMPLDVAVFGLTLVVVMAWRTDWQLGATLTVDVVHGKLLTDELGTALGIALTCLTVVDTRHAYTRLHINQPSTDILAIRACNSDWKQPKNETKIAHYPEAR